MKKIIVLMMVVIGVHCVAIAALFLVQGCKTTKKPTETSASQTPIMPPLTAPSAAPAKVEPVPFEVKGAETIEYTVKSGDSLGLIAKRHNISTSELMALNKLTDPNKIRIGQKLIIPKRSHAAIAAPVPKAAKANSKEKEKKSEPTPSLAAGINEYVVVAGDSLSKVSAKLKVKVSELREVNKLVNDKLKVGQKLIIPGAKKSEGTPEAAPAPAATETPASPSPAKTETPAVNPPSSVATPTPATTADGSSAAAPAKTSGSGITHVVAPNEDLSSIAKLYAVTVEDIVAANKFGSNQTVQAGQKIIIP